MDLYREQKEYRGFSDDELDEKCLDESFSELNRAFNCSKDFDSDSLQEEFLSDDQIESAGSIVTVFNNPKFKNIFDRNVQVNEKCCAHVAGNNKQITVSNDKSLFTPFNTSKSKTKSTEIKPKTEKSFDYESLFNVVIKHSVNSGVVKYNPPFIKSQFEFVPPTINFIYKDEKCNFIYYFVPRNFLF